MRVRSLGIVFLISSFAASAFAADRAIQNGIDVWETKGDGSTFVDFAKTPLCPAPRTSSPDSRASRLPPAGLERRRNISKAGASTFAMTMVPASSTAPTSATVVRSRRLPTARLPGAPCGPWGGVGSVVPKTLRSLKKSAIQAVVGGASARTCRRPGISTARGKLPSLSSSAVFFAEYSGMLNRKDPDMPVGSGHLSWWPGKGGLMIGLKRILQICILSILILSATAVFAEDVAAPGNNAVVSSPQAKPEAPSPQEGIKPGDLGIPEPINRSCTASTSCSTLGGTPIMCSGVSSCTFNTSWVLCDGNVTYCTCNPANIPTCADAAGFCACWNASPTNGWGVCRFNYC